MAHPTLLAYHLTPLSRLGPILSEGLSPEVPRDMPGDPKAVYLFTGLAELVDGFSTWFGERFEEDTEMVVLEVDISGFATLEGAGFEHVVPAPIPPHRILRNFPLHEVD